MIVRDAAPRQRRQRRLGEAGEARRAGQRAAQNVDEVGIGGRSQFEVVRRVADGRPRIFVQYSS
jgi:hypothetical protein